MHIKDFSARVITFKLAAALERYEVDLRALTDTWLDAELFRRLRDEFSELRILGASLPKLSVSWVEVLLSRARLLQALGGRPALLLPALQAHLAAVEGLHRRCLRMIGAQTVAPA
jgi:hypothetical protein